MRFAGWLVLAACTAQPAPVTPTTVSTIESPACPDCPAAECPEPTSPKCPELPPPPEARDWHCHDLYRSHMPASQVDESAFLGWELAVASKAGLSIDQWQTAQESYMLNDDRFDLLDSVALVKSLAPLLELPYVSGTGEPLAIRPRPRVRKRRPRAPSAQLTLF